MFISKRFLVLGLAILVGLLSSGSLIAQNSGVAADSVLESILSRGNIEVCSDLPFEPFEFEDDNGNLIGLDVDVVKLLAREMGIGFNANEDFIVTPFDTIIPLMNQGNCDMIVSDITATLSRGLTANFTDAYLNTGQIVMVSTSKSPGSSVTAYDQLNNSDVIISTQLGTTGEDAARNFFPNADIRTFDNAQLALQEVVDGNADAIVFDSVFLEPAQATVGSAGELCCPRGNPSPLTSEPIAIAIRKGDPDFLTYLNFFIREAGTNIRVTDDLAAEFDLPESTIGQSFLEAIRNKWLN
jgi:polar amino acid transport system substrate-binding protein